MYREMNMRSPVKHAALLVIVLSCSSIPAHAGQGWYLLTPPLDVTVGVAVERDAPLSRWDQSGGYDTATACETDIRIRTQLLKRHAADETRADWYRQQQRVLHERYLHALCVAADDPRLNQ